MMAAIPMELFFTGMLLLFIAFVSGVQAVGALVVSPARRKTYWRIVGIAHLSFLAPFVLPMLAAPLPRSVSPYVGLTLIAAGCFWAVIVCSKLVRKTGWTRIGPCALFFPMANAYTGLIATSIVTYWFRVLTD
jgi:hypothetical protein